MAFFALFGFIFLVILAAVILSIILHLLRHFFWRVCVLEGAGVRESLRRGFAFVRENWRNVGLMWLVMIGLGIVWAVASIILFLVTIPVVLVTAMLALLVIVIWHIYNAIFSPEVFPLDTAIFTGKISRERMVHEHPIELARLEGVSVEEILKHAHGEQGTPKPGAPTG